MIWARGPDALFFHRANDLWHGEIRRSTAGMRSLTMRRRRPSGTPRRSIEPRRRRWLVPERTHCAVLIFCPLLTGGQAAAQRSPVAVDLGALDALGPAPANPGANPSGRVRLHPPNPPAERKASTPATTNPAPAAAGAPSPPPAPPPAPAAPPAPPPPPPRPRATPPRP